MLYDVRVGGLDGGRRDVNDEVVARGRVDEVLRDLLHALLHLHLSQLTIRALAVRVAAVAIGTGRRGDLALRDGRILVDAGTDGARCLAVSEVERVDDGSSVAGARQSVAEEAEAGEGDRHGDLGLRAVGERLLRVAKHHDGLIRSGVGEEASIEGDSGAADYLGEKEVEGVPLATLQVFHCPLDECAIVRVENGSG